MSNDRAPGRIRSARSFTEVLAVLAVVVILGMTVWYFRQFYSRRIGPEQPLPFSHRVHATVKKVSCFMCHDGALKTATAGIPALQTCMLCHSRIIVTFPYIEILRKHYFSRKPILWERVYNLPDFVYFNHAIHINRSIDCSRCHGNVSAMDRVEKAVEINMGFCVTCHREMGATHDCFTCHR